MNSGINWKRNGRYVILLAAAPPSYMYTNIRGGVGVFGGISVAETDWMPNVELPDQQL